MSATPLDVVKVGGSLFDHPALGEGLRRWIAQRPIRRLLLLPGGGELADVVRGYHRTHRILEDVCHWMAIRAMQLNAVLLNDMLLEACDVDQPLLWPNGTSRVGVLNVFDFVRADESESRALPHNWKVTSDAIAARVAEVAGTSKLVLLKSVDLPAGISWSEASQQGLVDVMFGEVVRRANLSVEWLNFRSYLNNETWSSVGERS
jgi:aspartokinase-like uncharacterized kinase